MDFEQTLIATLIVVGMLFNIVSMFLMHQSVPAGKVAKLFDTLETLAKQSPSQLDDQAVGLGRALASLITGQALNPPPPEAPTVTTVTAVATEVKK